MELKCLRHNEEDIVTKTGLLYKNGKTRAIKTEHWRRDKVVRETVVRQGCLGA